jgi:hypothetical protein
LEHLYSGIMVERGTEWDGSDVEHRWQRRLRGMSGTSEDGADNYPPIQSSAHDRSSSTPTRESVVWRSKGKWREAATSHSRLHALAGSNRPEATEGSPLVQLRRREKNGASYEAAEGGREVGERGGGSGHRVRSNRSGRHAGDGHGVWRRLDMSGEGRRRDRGVAYVFTSFTVF